MTVPVDRVWHVSDVYDTAFEPSVHTPRRSPLTRKPRPPITCTRRGARCVYSSMTSFGASKHGLPAFAFEVTANLCTNIMDFRGFDSSIILMLRGGISRRIGKLPGSLSQAILVGIMLVGRLGIKRLPGAPLRLHLRGSPAYARETT